MAGRQGEDGYLAYSYLADHSAELGIDRTRLGIAGAFHAGERFAHDAALTRSLNHTWHDVLRRHLVQG